MAAASTRRREPHSRTTYARHLWRTVYWRRIMWRRNTRCLPRNHFHTMTRLQVCFRPVRREPRPVIVRTWLDLVRWPIDSDRYIAVGVCSSGKVRSLWENEMILSCLPESHDVASLIEEIYAKILGHDLLMNFHITRLSVSIGSSSILKDS